MAKWRDVKQNRGLEEKSNSKIKSPKSDLASLPSRLSFFIRYFFDHYSYPLYSYIFNYGKW